MAWNNVKQLPNRLREFREAADMTLQDLAAKTDKAYQTISEYELGKQEMPEDFLVKAQSVLQKSRGEILEKPARGLFLNDPQFAASNDATLRIRMMELERKEFVAAIDWLVGRDKDRDALLLASRRSELKAVAKNMIQSAINAADENEKTAAQKGN